MYITKKFKILPWDDLKNHISIISKHYPLAEKIFVADGNALVLPTEHWVRLLKQLKADFAHVKRISSYATPGDILRKDIEELKTIRNNGLSLLYMGIESGNDDILRDINKGVKSEEIITAGKKAIAAGFELSVTIIAGVGGEKFHEHAFDTAKVISAIQPNYVGMLTLMVEPGTVLAKALEKGEFKLGTPLDYLKEAKIFLENVDLKNTVFRSNHASNYLSLAGNLNRDRQKLLDMLNHALNNPEVLKPEYYRGL